MSATVESETTVPLLPCESVEELIGFYQSLGFAVTHFQEEPYPYLSVERGGIQLHFSRLSVYGAKKAFGSYLAFVPDIAACHQAFADGLRTQYGRIPTAGFPRISRLRPGHTRFKVFDPSGNMGIFIVHQEPEGEYGSAYENPSETEQAMENAVFLRDVYSNDVSAAGLLDSALKRITSATPIERARLLAARAELAVALGEAERIVTLRHELSQEPLTDAEREQFREELAAADELERWLVE